MSLRYDERMTTWVLLAGPPATGKSTLAKALAEQLERVAVLDKDRVRAALFPGSMTDYSPAQDDLCVHAMLEAAGYITLLNRAQFIFFDGRTFSRRAQIDTVLSAAKAAGATWKILSLTCSDDTAMARLQEKDPDHPAGNRTIELYQRVKAAFEPIDHPKLELDTTHGVSPVLKSALDYLRI
jgi:predicted kinase